MDVLKLKLEEFLKIKKINYYIVVVMLFFSFIVVIWAFLNNDQDSLGEKIFFVTTSYIYITGLYVFLIYSRARPMPEDINFDSLFEYQKTMAVNTYRANRIFQTGYIQMIIISWMGIIIMERPNDPNLWIFCLGFVAIGVLLTWRSLWTGNWARKEFSRLTGENFIPTI